MLLVYANKSYQNLMVQGYWSTKELNSPVFTEGFGEGYTESNFMTERFEANFSEIEEHFIRK
jgi:hypothetical protein